MEMYPHPDSLRSRYAARPAPALALTDHDKPQEQQQICSALTLPLPFGTESRIRTPMSSHLNTPRDASNSAGFKDRVTNFTRILQQRSGASTARDLERQLLERGITPIYQPEGWINEPLPNVLVVLDVSDVRTFVSRPAPRGCGPIQCYIRRQLNADRIFPRYELYLTDEDRFLLSARKRKKSMSSNYIISLDPDDISRKTGNFFGKIRSNFLGTEFWFYDRGARHTFGKSTCFNKRAELGAVTYGTNLLGLRGPRKMTAIIPAVNPEDGKPFVFQSMLPPASHSMLTKHRSGHDQSKMLVMHNKLPVWNKEFNAYCLNFQGRVTEPSVKNFQMAIDTDQDYVILQFGKIAKDTYNLDYQHPLSALQAFAICLTSLDYKIACE